MESSLGKLLAEHQAPVVPFLVEVHINGQVLKSKECLEASYRLGFVHNFAREISQRTMDSTLIELKERHTDTRQRKFGGDMKWRLEDIRRSVDARWWDAATTETGISSISWPRGWVYRFPIDGFSRFLSSEASASTTPKTELHEARHEKRTHIQSFQYMSLVHCERILPQSICCVGTKMKLFFSFWKGKCSFLFLVVRREIWISTHCRINL